MLNFQEFFDQYIKKDLREIIEKTNAKYLAFILICDYINVYMKSNDSYYEAVRVFFANKYKFGGNVITENFSFFVRSFSNLFTQVPDRFVVTERNDPDFGDKHMQLVKLSDGVQRRVVVCEDFYNDLLELADHLYNLMEKGDLVDFRKIKTHNPNLK